MLNQLLGHNYTAWCKAGGHGITDETGFVYFSDIKYLAEQVAANGDKIWMPSIQKLIKYLYVRDGVGYNQVLEGNKLTITFDQSLIPSYVKPRFLTFKISSGANIASITTNISGAKKTGVGTQNGLVDVQLLE